MCRATRRSARGLGVALSADRHPRWASLDGPADIRERPRPVLRSAVELVADRAAAPEPAHTNTCSLTRRRCHSSRIRQVSMSEVLCTDARSRLHARAGEAGDAVKPSGEVALEAAQRALLGFALALFA